MMVPLNPANKHTSQRRIVEGGTVVVYERHNAMCAIAARAGGVLRNRFGIFRHDNWIGLPFGSKVIAASAPKSCLPPTRWPLPFSSVPPAAATRK
jgi:tRNA (adenine57-N1/adenine58-N1)-methyltransferase